MSNEYKKHYSVQLNDCLSILENLFPKEEYLFMDGTFGGGGHTFAFIEKVKNSKIYSFDQDPEAFQNGLKRISEENKTGIINIINDNFKNFEKHLSSVKGKIDAIILDLGVSSHHFDKGERGFSFKFDAPLDMRMDFNKNDLTAEYIINNYSENSLIELFFKYGEEKFSKKIARIICETREKEKISTTIQLAELIKNAYPAKLRFGRIHPATKIFQALRIEVNDELKVIEDSIPIMFDYLAQDGFLMIISFHSLEDRIVKHCFKKLFNENPDSCTIITKKPILPSEEELIENSRSRSAKLRVLKKAKEVLSEKKKKYQSFKKQNNRSDW